MKTVKTLARTMLAYERLGRCRSGGPSREPAFRLCRRQPGGRAARLTPSPMRRLSQTVKAGLPSVHNRSMRRAVIGLAVGALAFSPAGTAATVRSPAAVVRAWSAALARDDNQAAANLFARTAVVVQNGLALVLADGVAGSILPGPFSD